MIVGASWHPEIQRWHPNTSSFLVPSRWHEANRMRRRTFYIEVQVLVQLQLQVLLQYGPSLD